MVLALIKKLSGQNWGLSGKRGGPKCKKWKMKEFRRGLSGKKYLISRPFFLIIFWMACLLKMIANNLIKRALLRDMWLSFNEPSPA
ncbi:hypothetical protein GCWU000182_00935 [Abiotrophia defectiva ATCC 49176]|uniref:Uncharacterized protein n=1 Tax=Abiotrophia defectiva ATCC 49176 TaxID=592010 RepID=W1Q3A1_ABIDE|nr:hypothetical protein GCWU000182_00935 [Abiotrophia defectiva ATCC 49176]